jgi:hypothetical protein
MVRGGWEAVDGGGDEDTKLAEEMVGSLNRRRQGSRVDGLDKERAANGT